MSLARSSIVAMLLVAVGISAGCRGANSSEPPIVPIRNMYNQPRYDPHQSSPFFEDGRTMRPRVEGTVAQEEAPSLATSTGRLEDNTAWVLEVPPDVVERHGGKPAMVSRGQERYDVFCVPCHDYTGAGEGTVADRARALGAAALVPPSLHDERIRKMPDGQLFATISHGVRGMPPYAYGMGADDRWAVASYVRALQVFQSARGAAPAGTEGKP